MGLQALRHRQQSLATGDDIIKKQDRAPFNLLAVAGKGAAQILAASDQMALSGKAYVGTPYCFWRISPPAERGFVFHVFRDA